MVRWAVLTAALTAFAAPARAQTIPDSATISVRTLDDVHADPRARGAVVRAMSLAPIYAGARVVVAPRTIFEGRIEDAGTEKSGGKRHFVRLAFTTIVLGDGTRVPISARVVSVDNAREVIDSAGRIVGPPFMGLARAKSDWASLILGTLNPVAGAVLFAAFRSEEFERYRRVEFASGTDMTLRLADDVPMPGWPEFRPPADLTTEADLGHLVDALPLRARAAGGRVAGDFVNVVALGTEEEVRRAFEAAGWAEPARMSLKSDFATFLRAAVAEGYAHQPVSKQLMFNRAPDLVFQRVTNTFAKRHHVRLWNSGVEWHGRPVWVAAATHDIGIEFSLADRSFTHRVNPDIDSERDKVVSDLVAALHVEAVASVLRVAPPDGAAAGPVRSDWRVSVVQLNDVPLEKRGGAGD